MVAKINQIFWALAPYLGVAGIIYGTWEYAIYYGLWMALLVSGLMGIMGWLAVEILYPMWFGGGHGNKGGQQSDKADR